MPRSFTVSVRDKNCEDPIFRWLGANYPGIDVDLIDSVFGFSTHSRLYGGRIYSQPQLSQSDISALNDRGIGYRIPLTNHYYDGLTDDDHRFLAHYDNGLNSVIVVNDNLASDIKARYSYKVEASVIKALDTVDKVTSALDIYDTVVTPMHKNDDHNFLSSIPSGRVRLFANAFCAYTCPAKVCYRSFSRINRGEDVKPACSLPKLARDFEGMHDFDIEYFSGLGFDKFKLIRDRRFANS